jgi:hypothetical protein
MYIDGTLVSYTQVETIQGQNGVINKCFMIVQINGTYPKKVAIQFMNDKINLLQSVRYTEVRVHVNPSSNESNGRWFTNLDGWKVEPIPAAATQGAPQAQQPVQNQPVQNWNQPQQNQPVQQQQPVQAQAQAPVQNQQSQFQQPAPVQNPVQQPAPAQQQWGNQPVSQEQWNAQPQWNPPAQPLTQQPAPQPVQQPMQPTGQQTFEQQLTVEVPF